MKITDNVTAISVLAFVAVVCIGVLVVIGASLTGRTLDAQAYGLLQTIMQVTFGLLGGTGIGAVGEALYRRNHPSA